MKNRRNDLIIFSITIILIISFYIAKSVLSADGSGTNMVSPNAAVTASTGNTFTFTFTSAETMDSGELFVDVNANFSSAQDTPGTLGYTTLSSTNGIFADVEYTADSISGWVKENACSSGTLLSIDGSIKKEGIGSLSCQNGNENDGERWENKLTVTEDWSSYTKVGFWIRANSALSAGNLDFAYDDSQKVDSPLETIALPAISANTWTYVVLNFGATTRTTINGYGFYIRSATALDNVTVWVDDILLGPGSPSFSSGDISVRFLQLASGKTVNITYGSGGGTSGVTVPLVDGEYTFTTKTRIDDSGTLTNIVSSPIIYINAEGEPPSNAPITTLRPLYTTIRFFGQAYPETKVIILEKTADDLKTIQEENVSSDQGLFSSEIVGDISGNRTYGVLLEDKNGDRIPARFYNFDIGFAAKIETEIFAPPTIRLDKNKVSYGGSIVISGYATPGNEIEFKLDDISRRNNFLADNNGFYKVTLDINMNDIGNHIIQARQLDNHLGKKSEWSLQQLFEVVKTAKFLGDFNGDDIINISDWSIFLSIWGGTDESAKAQLDLNNDGKTDISDFSLFIINFKK